MATLIGDVFADSARFHSIITGPGASHSQRRNSRNRSVSHSRDRDAPPSQNPHHPHPQPQSHPHPPPTTRAPSPGRQDVPTPGSGARRGGRKAHDEAAGEPDLTGAAEAPQHKRVATTAGGVSRFPSPPPSSSPSEPSSASARPQHVIPGYMVPMSEQPTPGSGAASDSSASSTSTDATIVPSSRPRSMPSPDSDSGPPWDPAANQSKAPDAGLLERPSSPMQTQTTIRVRDLAHIQSLAKADLLTATGPGILNDPPLQQMKYEISGMPIGDIIEMVAALLTKITTTNDLQHDALNRNANHVKQAQAQAQAKSEDDSTMSPLSSSVLAFHGKNVPAITILSYLSRIHKYCPTTYEVFLSLLVYFDRMTERVNDLVRKSEESRRLHAFAQAQIGQPLATNPSTSPDIVMRDDDDDDNETDSDLADDDEKGGGQAPPPAAPRNNTLALVPQATYFVVDSFNIHRLIIAGVTCASKFFSDVFYTNSRYAKVGGLPLAELNHLELQFLLLNDFRLAVPVEDLEAYATMLVEFYAREVIAQRSRPVVAME